MWHKAETFDSSKLVLHNVRSDSSGRKQVCAWVIFSFTIIKFTLKSWGDKFRNFKKDKTIFALEIDYILPTWKQEKDGKLRFSSRWQENLRKVFQLIHWFTNHRKNETAPWLWPKGIPSTLPLVQWTRKTSRCDGCFEPFNSISFLGFTIIIFFKFFFQPNTMRIVLTFFIISSLERFLS